MSTLIPIYQQRSDQFAAEIKHWEKRSALFSSLRFVMFLLFIFIFYVWTKGTLDFTLGILFLLLCITGFLFLLKEHKNVRKRLKRVTLLKLLNDQEIGIQRHQDPQWDKGLAFQHEDSFAGDLDIFGPSSLYLFLHRCGTIHGKKRLAIKLQNPDRDAANILSRQEILKELAPKIDFRQELWMQANWEDPVDWDSEGFQKWILQPPFQSQKLMRMLSILWPILMTGSIIISIVIGQYFLVILMVVLALSLVGLKSKRIKMLHNTISDYTAQFANESKLLKLIADEDLTHPRLKKYKQTATRGTLALYQLGRIAKSLDDRINGLVFITLNSLWLHDFWIVNKVLAWRKKYRDEWQAWFTCIAEFEYLNSLATWAYNHPDYCWPTPANKWLFQNVGHPLIPQPERVNNDFSLTGKQKIVLITGSNMAGKSTFLRTIGINCILAALGTKVCVTKMFWQPLPLGTSIRISDSLSESTSFFMAELKKLQSLLSFLEQGQEMLLLLDEVLKGTNSQDKQYGAEKLVEKLVHLPGITFLASHITELGVLAKKYPEEIVNYCFESQIDNDQLRFDYKLRPGIAQHKNATFLMKKMGII